MKKTFLFTLLLFGLLNITGCAALFNQKKVVAPVISTPSGAKVYVDGVYKGLTPLHVELSNDENHILTFSKDGYKDQSFAIKKKIGAKWVVLDILGFAYFIPIIVDATTGSWYELDHEEVSILLDNENISN